MGSSSRRGTQIDMLGLAGVSKPLPSSSGSAGSPRLNSPIKALQKNALGKKRAGRSGEGEFDTGIESDKETSKPDGSLTANPSRLRTAWESPWKRYQKIYDRELAGPTEVAVRREQPVELVHVRKFQKPGSEKVLLMVRKLQHCNIVAALDVFTTDDALYIVLEPMSISLEEIVRSPAYPEERQLAAILGQVSSIS